MSKRARRFSGVMAVLAFVAWSVGAGTALAGTTGSLRGVVTEIGGAPIAGVTVTVTSPSQTASTVTDSGGHFTFASLAPDDYAVSAEKAGYDKASYAGAVVFADVTQVLTVTMRKQLKTIATTTSRSSSSLVRPGTTSDVYSINAAQQARTSVLGGGGTLNSAYSAISAVPGAYVPTNQAGYNLAIHIRGGDSSEVGYELDGIPMNRGIDGYTSSSVSSLGQLELQVYTGASPADSEGQGLAGFINQVIKSGTYPGYGVADATFGSPTYYHSLNVEAGGATPDRLFSYYVGIGGFNQDHRFVDQWNGQSYANEFGPVLDGCPAPQLTPNGPQLPSTAPPSCFTNGKPNVGQAGVPGYILGPVPYGLENASIIDRSTVLNFHIGIKHKNDGGRDDVQLLYNNDSIFSPLFVSPYDQGLSNFQGTTYGPAAGLPPPYPQCTSSAIYPPQRCALPYYLDWYQYNGPSGEFLPSPAQAASLTVPYYFPASPRNRAMFASLPLTTRDVQYNQSAVTKIQYQKNFSSDAYLRLYGYTYFSTYAAAGAVSSWQPYTGYDSGDYELNAHTRGLSGIFAKQFGSKHLVNVQASYTTATSMDMNNAQMFGAADNFAILVNPHDLKSGTCYAAPSGTSGAASPTTCNPGSWAGGLGPNASAPTFASMGAFGFCAQTAGCNPATVNPLASNYTCGGAACAFYVVENGPYGQVERVVPTFYGYAITDEYRPSDKVVINAGVRLDSYNFIGENTTGTAARAFWVNAFNQDTCYNTQNLTLYDKTALTDKSGNPLIGGPGGVLPCSAAGTSYQKVNMVNAQTNFFYNVWQPRIGATYALNPNTVLRASWGKYNEQPSSSYEQYNALQQNLPTELQQYYSQGFNTPGHEVRPAISFNSDLSLEHRFNGTDLSFKLTPFLRQTHDEIENFYINIKEGIIAGLNAGNETSTGFELAVDKGDFERDGFAGSLSFAYTNVYVKFSALPNGSTVLSPINADIANYNAYTAACAPGGRDAGRKQYGTPFCGSTSNGRASAACYTTSGAPDPACATGDVANPYWNAPPQPLLDPNGKYLPYSIIPGGIGTGVNAYNYPYVATLILNYKRHKFAITPSLQFVAGNRYGAPETMPGIDPAAGCGVLSGSVKGDPRYPYGAPGGSPFDATSCAAQLNAIPNSFTGQFDSLGEFRQPAQIVGHVQLSYDLTPKVSLTLTLANLVSTCFGGQRTAFTYYYSGAICNYGGLANALPPVGNVYNPGDNVQTFQRYPYEPDFGTFNDLNSSTVNPFSAYFNVKVKI